MDDSRNYSPCTTVAYVEGACTGNNYNQPVLQSGYSYSLPNSSTANPCYCSWSSYNLMMACTLCQEVNDTAVWRQVIRLLASVGIGCTTNQSWTQEYFPSGYLLTGDASIPYWATTNPANWTYETFNILNANTTYQNNNSSITPGVSSSYSGSGSSPSSSSSSSSSKSTDVGAIVGGTVGGAAALLFLVIAAYILYRRHVYRNASVINQQGTTFIPQSGTHNRIPSDTSNFSASMSGSLGLYGQPAVSSSQQYETSYSPQPQTAYPSLQGSYSPIPRTDMTVYTTHSSNGRPGDVIPMV
ncbi:uncharacterized protein F5891DRAFT_1180281 [Suillus fuscotomentosus]|uniref:Transmembrane protein n=1 Tax=Suillus fuscotomentosus TaxID=1912939 RepID=A0AAD4EMC6_9AGAM|nr:uncharacterized protein F5891DRAFT_1180281 [Suillus fuscotomentosus]KAG1908736.1 hypothetical protein F5891DRAFT_1180281 [Suillus fuscotomentosus]